MNEPHPIPRSPDALAPAALPAEALRYFVETASLPLLALDAQGKVACFNRHLLEVIHRPAGTLEGFALMEALPGRSVSILKAHLERVLAEKLPAQCEIEWRVPGGAVQWLRLTSHPGAETGDRALCWSVVENLTEVRRLEKMDMAYRLLADAAQAAVTPREFGGKLFEVLRQLFDVAGGFLALYDPMADRIHFLVAPGPDAPPAEGYPAEETLVRHLLSTGRTVWWHDLRSSGESTGPAFSISGPVPGDLIAIPLRDGDHMAGALVVKSGDGGHRFNAREVEMVIGAACLVELVVGRGRSRERERDQRAALEQVSEVVMVTDDQGVMLYVNQAFELVTGYTRQEALGRNASILHSGRNDREFHREMWSLLKQGRTWRGRFHNRRKNGETYEEEAIIFPVVHSKDAATHFVAVKRDLEHGPGMGGLHGGDPEVMQRLASVFSHDFKNILLAIRNNAELLRPGLDHAEELQHILQGADQAEVLLADWVGLSASPGSEKMITDINQQIIRFENVIRKLVGENHDVAFDLSPRLPPVRLISGQLEYLLTGLLLLGLRTASGGGGFTIRTHSEEIGDKHKDMVFEVPVAGNHLYAVIEISGPGIAGDYASPDPESIWNRGVPPLSARMRKLRGGLSVKRLPPEGPAVRLYFPAEKPATERVSPLAPVSEPAAPVAAGGHETVLVAEDDAGARRIMSRLLQDQGYTVLEAENGAMAIRTLLFHEGKIELLLTDVMMPDFDGRILAGQIVGLKPGIKVIYTSGYDLAELEEKGIFPRGESVSLVKKPFRRDELLTLVRRTLDAR